jgi:GH24 family phage-related lysozyme (muramidase)
MKIVLFLILLCPLLLAQTTTAIGVELIKHYEGFRGKAYLCPASVQTVGYGHLTSKPMVITEYEAEQLLMQDLPRYEKYVSKSSLRYLRWY